MSSNFTEAELSLVSRVMTVADPHELGIVSGEAALGIFQRSHLPPSVLSEIWDLADEGSHGHLTERGVAIAIRLMGWAQCGEGINESLVERGMHWLDYEPARRSVCLLHFSRSIPSS